MVGTDHFNDLLGTGFHMAEHMNETHSCVETTWTCFLLFRVVRPLGREHQGRTITAQEVTAQQVTAVTPVFNR